MIDNDSLLYEQGEIKNKLISINSTEDAIKVFGDPDFIERGTLYSETQFPNAKPTIRTLGFHSGFRFFIVYITEYFDGTIGRSYGEKPQSYDAAE